MTNYNGRLDEVLTKHGAEPGEMTHSLKQAITSLIKELVAEAKPEIPVATSWQQGIEKKAFEDAIRVYEYKLLKALEEVE